VISACANPNCQANFDYGQRGRFFRFHAAGARGFKWAVGSIEAEVHARSEKVRPSKVEIGDINDGDRIAKS
jgi:hypothetical protein